MKICIGSTNNAKIAAVKEIIADYPILASAEVTNMDVDSRVPKQPTSLQDIVIGAMNRAEGAFKNCNYSFGIESGIFQLPTTVRYMDICVCAIYDGKDRPAIGYSSGFEVPPEILKFIFKGMELREATLATGLTTEEDIGNSKGLVDILTNGRLDRKGLTIEAVRNALIILERKELYKR